MHKLVNLEKTNTFHSLSGVANYRELLIE